MPNKQLIMYKINPHPLFDIIYFPYMLLTWYDCPQ